MRSQRLTYLPDSMRYARRRIRPPKKRHVFDIDELLDTIDMSIDYKKMWFDRPKNLREKMQIDFAEKRTLATGENEVLDKLRDNVHRAIVEGGAIIFLFSGKRGIYFRYLADVLMWYFDLNGLYYHRGCAKERWHDMMQPQLPQQRHPIQK